MGRYKVMKKVFRFSLAALFFAFMLTALTGFGEGKVSAAISDTVSEDLDGDGKEETVAYEIIEAEDFSTLASITINGEDVYKATKTKKPLTSFNFNVYVFDTCTKDSFKEVVVEMNIEESTTYVFYRYDNGSIIKYASVYDGDGLVSQKNKGRIRVQTYLGAQGLGNFFVEADYKIKSGNAKLYTKTFKPDKRNAAVSFKSTQKMTVYTDTDFSEIAGTLKKGEKFKVVKFKLDSDGFCTTYIKTKSGVTGWIDTRDFGYSKFIIKNPPVWD